MLIMHANISAVLVNAAPILQKEIERFKGGFWMYISNDAKQHTKAITLQKERNSDGVCEDQLSASADRNE